MNPKSCPLRVGSAGHTYDCKKQGCAWWDESKNQCAVKSFLVKNNQSTTVTIERNPFEEGGR